MLDHMILHFGHGVADGDVVVQQLPVAASIPLGEGRKLLGDGVEETDDDADRCCLHVVAELVDGGLVRNAVVAVELHLFPDSKQDGGEHEDCGPVLESVTAVHARVE